MQRDQSHCTLSAPATWCEVLGVMLAIMTSPVPGITPDISLDCEAFHHFASAETADRRGPAGSNRHVGPGLEFIVTIQTGTVEHHKTQYKTMWTLYLEILFFLQFVTTSVIPEKRKLAERKTFKHKIIEENHHLSRKKRTINLEELDLEELDSNSEEEEESWNRQVCRSREGVSRLRSSVDQHGNRVLVLGSLSSHNRDYIHYVKTQRCAMPDHVVMVGGQFVKCVQRYLEETLVVLDENTGEELYSRSINLPSGCEAMREH